MKKASKSAKRGRVHEQMREEYDFSKGVRGKYAVRFSEGTNLIPIVEQLRISPPAKPSTEPPASAPIAPLRELPDELAHDRSDR